MVQEIEIEFKNLLTKSEFQYLLHTFFIKEEVFQTQINYYFDTADFSLKKLKTALRIRLKDEKYTLTLKQAINEGALETHQPITKSEADLMLNNNHFPAGEIKNLLNKNLVIIENINFIGTLTTHRAELSFQNGILVFDHSQYLNHEDYELEYEVNNREQGYRSFMNLLKTHRIPIRKTKNKIQRFFEVNQNE